MAIIKSVKPGQSKQALKNVIEYVTREDKTTRTLLTGLNCNPDTVLTEMLCTKNFHGKNDGRQYMHFVQSFPLEDNITHTLANEIAEKLAKEMFQGYEVLMATHTDREHAHTHFIVNSVGFEDGVKIRMSKHDLQRMKDLSDRLCIEHGLSVYKKGLRNVDFSTFSQEKYHAIKKASKGLYKSYVLNIAREVSKARDTAISREDFISKLKAQGIATEWSDNRKYIVFTDSEGHKVRNSNIEKTFNIPMQKEDLLARFEARDRANNPELAAMRVNELAKSNVILKAESKPIYEMLQVGKKPILYQSMINYVKEQEETISKKQEELNNAKKEHENTAFYKPWKKEKLKNKITDLEETIVAHQQRIQDSVRALRGQTIEDLQRMLEERLQLEDKYRAMKAEIESNSAEIKEVYRQFGNSEEFLRVVDYDEFGQVVANAPKDEVSKAQEEMIQLFEWLADSQENTDYHANEVPKTVEKAKNKEVEFDLGDAHITLDDVINGTYRNYEEKNDKQEVIHDYEYDYEER